MSVYDQKSYLKRKIRNKLISVDSTGIIRASYDGGLDSNNRMVYSEIENTILESDNDESRCSLKMLNNEDILSGNSYMLEINNEIKIVEPKVILWNENIAYDSTKMDKLREEYFTPASVPCHKTTSAKPFTSEKSPLSLMIEKVGINMNPFLKYIQYDIKNNPGTTKMLTYSIKINSLFEGKRLNVENVNIYVSPNTLVKSAIGLILYKIEAAHPKAITETNINCYSLFILDVDGVIDEDMPALDHNKNIGNYQFGELAISCDVAQHRKEALMNEIALHKPNVERPLSIPFCDLNMPNSKDDTERYHAIIFWSKGQSTFEFTDKNFTLRDLIVIFYKKRGKSAPVTSAFYFEHEENPGVPINIQNLVLNYEPPVFTLHIEYNDLEETADLTLNQFLNINKHHHFFQGTIILNKHKQGPVHVRVENKTIEYLPQRSAKSSLKKANTAHPPEPISILVQIASIISIEDTPYRKMRNFQLVVVKYQEDKRTNKVTVLFKKEDADEFVKVLQAMQQSLKSFTHSTII